MIAAPLTHVHAKIRGSEFHRGDAVIFQKKKEAIFAKNQTSWLRHWKTYMGIWPKLRVPPISTIGYLLAKFQLNRSDSFFSEPKKLRAYWDFDQKC